MNAPDMTGFEPGAIVRQYHHTSMYDDAEILQADECGALLVRCLSNGVKYGWSARRCEVIEQPRESA
jgi:hypothetical protein